MKKTLTAIGFLLCSSAFAALPGAGSFWDKSGEGYWWYAQDPQTPKPIKPQPKKQPPVVVVEAKEKKTEQPTETPTPPAVFSADWVEENLKVYRRLAWDNPTVENLRAYLYLQRFAMDRSEQFAYAGQMAVQGDPFLDEVARAPLGGSMNVNRTSYINAEQGRLLKKLYERVGIFFVFKNRCYICDEQAQVLKNASRNLGITVKAISIDTPEPGNVTASLFPDYIVNPNIVQQLNIRALPSSFFLDAQTADIKPLVQGFVTLSDLNRRAISAAKQYKWLPDSDFDYVKPFDDVTSLASVLETDSPLAAHLESIKEQSNPYGKDTNFIDPGVLVEEIRKAKTAQIPTDFVPRGY
ncbi:MAG: conjugal transfer protein TraF [Candidatus Anaerobiospirillum merdipullorum]|uniref:Conjugal transfer protein TraF n=1 Tax=Candidatus Anaerobiospirillum merdipullorum TaxID=2838450 RepID=A0A9E2NSB1_9GAMM|nr:conjugal transfer protein TraF [Candidatus Anaerobiospirillum merdipullorum]